MREDTRRRLIALMDDARLRDCDETVRVELAAMILTGARSNRGTLALSELTPVYTKLRDGADRTAEDLLCPVVAELISLARATQHCDDAETRVVRMLALYEATQRPEGGAA